MPIWPPTASFRTWTPGEVTAVLDGTRPAHWADDFPADGDRVIAGMLTEYPAWLGTYGHRQIIERGSRLVVGSIGLFWPPSDGILEIGYGIVASRQGRGYASEVTRALTEFAFTAPGVHTIYANVELSSRTQPGIAPHHRPRPADRRVQRAKAQTRMRHHAGEAGRSVVSDQLGSLRRTHTITGRSFCSELWYCNDRSTRWSVESQVTDAALPVPSPEWAPFVLVGGSCSNLSLPY